MARIGGGLSQLIVNDCKNEVEGNRILFKLPEIRVNPCSSKRGSRYSIKTTYLSMSLILLVTSRFISSLSIKIASI